MRAKRVVVGLLAGALVGVSCTTEPDTYVAPPPAQAPAAPMPPPQASPPEQTDSSGPESSSTTTDPVIAAAGDIACDPASRSYNNGAGTSAACRQVATYKLLTSINPTRVLTLGDNQYERGTLATYRQAYAASWGRLRARTRPVPGNHEYATAGATGYYDYFGSLAGSRSRGYYSYNVGAWHLIALNSNCAAVGGCGAGSRQERWLRADLAANRNRCTLAYWHHSRWSSGLHGNSSVTAAFWSALYKGGADVVLGGHDHSYERFAPQNPAGGRDDARGLRQFVVGSGGRSHYPFKTVRPNSQARNATTFGVLKLVLRPTSYAWRFVPEAGRTYTDSGSATCH